MQEHKKDPIFFSLLDFAVEGGHSLRVIGIINEIAKSGRKPILISNCNNFDLFHKDVRHIDLNLNINRYEKSLMQLLISVLPSSLFCLYYREITKRIDIIFKNNDLINNSVFFFENVDFCISYLMLKKNIINNIIIDRPGIAKLEFDYKSNYASNIKDKVFFKIKSFIALLLENIILENSSKIIVASNIMMNHYKKNYKIHKTLKFYNIPYYLDTKQLKSKVNVRFKEEILKKYNIKDNDTVIFFIGEFKRTGGVPDLVKAFIKLYKKNKNNKLILVGGGYSFDECISLAKHSEARNNIIFEQRIPYMYLRSYQDLADIIVCPDRDNSFSRMIIHLKFWDALSSNKIVLCSGFKPILKINKNEKLCVNFIPSSINSLEEKSIYVIKNKNKLLKKFSKNREYVENNFTYSSIRTNLLEIFND